MGTLRLSVRLTLFVLFLLATTLLALCLGIAERIRGDRIDRAPWSRHCFRACCACLGLTIRQRGEPSPVPALVVCNHISWTDIPVLGSLFPVTFLSKAEVARWPLIGWLATQGNTLFIHRGAGQAAKSREDISRTLRRGQSVLIFPEGTTTSGLTVLPFHRRLLAAASAAEVRVQPVSIGYLRDGQPDHLAPFIGEDSFHHHLIRLLQQPAPEIRVIFHSPVEVTDATAAEPLARQLHETVMNGLQQIGHGGPAPTTETGDKTGIARPGEAWS